MKAFSPFRALQLFIIFAAFALSGAVRADDRVALTVDADALMRAVDMAARARAAIERVNTPSYPCPQEGWSGSHAQLQEGDTVRGAAMLFVTHAATIWDGEATIREGVNRRVAEIGSRGVPVVYLVDSTRSESIDRYYLRYRPDYLYVSNGGEHEVKLDVDNIIFAGGFFNLCAGETSRDAFLHTVPTRTPIRATYLTDSLYTTRGRPLHDLLREMNDEQMIEFLGDHYFTDSELGLQNGLQGRHATLSDFTFEVRRDGRRIGSFGNGSRRVEMNFLVDGRLQVPAPRAPLAATAVGR